MKIHRNEFNGFFTLEAFTDLGKPIRQSDGSPTITDSRHCRDAEGELLKMARKAGYGPMPYSSRGIA